MFASAASQTSGRVLLPLQDGNNVMFEVPTNALRIKSQNDPLVDIPGIGVLIDQYVNDPKNYRTMFPGLSQQDMQVMFNNQPKQQHQQHQQQHQQHQQQQVHLEKLALPFDLNAYTVSDIPKQGPMPEIVIKTLDIPHVHHGQHGQHGQHRPTTSIRVHQKQLYKILSQAPLPEVIVKQGNSQKVQHVQIQNLKLVNPINQNPSGLQQPHKVEQPPRPLPLQPGQPSQRNQQRDWQKPPRFSTLLSVTKPNSSVPLTTNIHYPPSELYQPVNVQGRGPVKPKPAGSTLNPNQRPRNPPAPPTTSASSPVNASQRPRNPPTSGSYFYKPSSEENRKSNQSDVKPLKVKHSQEKPPQELLSSPSRDQIQQELRPLDEDFITQSKLPVDEIQGLLDDASRQTKDDGDDSFQDTLGEISEPVVQPTKGGVKGRPNVKIPLLEPRAPEQATKGGQRPILQETKGGRRKPQNPFITSGLLSDYRQTKEQDHWGTKSGTKPRPTVDVPLLNPRAPAENNQRPLQTKGGQQRIEDASSSLLSDYKQTQEREPKRPTQDEESFHPSEDNGPVIDLGTASQPATSGFQLQQEHSVKGKTNFKSFTSNKPLRPEDISLESALGIAQKDLGESNPQSQQDVSFDDNASGNSQDNIPVDVEPGSGSTDLSGIKGGHKKRPSKSWPRPNYGKTNPVPRPQQIPDVSQEIPDLRPLEPPAPDSVKGAPRRPSASSRNNFGTKSEQPTNTQTKTVELDNNPFPSSQVPATKGESASIASRLNIPKIPSSPLGDSSSGVKSSAASSSVGERKAGRPRRPNPSPSSVSISNLRPAGELKGDRRGADSLVSTVVSLTRGEGKSQISLNHRGSPVESTTLLYDSLATVGHGLDLTEDIVVEENPNDITPDPLASPVQPYSPPLEEVSDPLPRPRTVPPILSVPLSPANRARLQNDQRATNNVDLIRPSFATENRVSQPAENRDNKPTEADGENKDVRFGERINAKEDSSNVASTSNQKEDNGRTRRIESSESYWTMPEKEVDQGEREVENGKDEAKIFAEDSYYEKGVPYDYEYAGDALLDPNGFSYEVEDGVVDNLNKNNNTVSS